jgi:hypothetical protein
MRLILLRHAHSTWNGYEDSMSHDVERVYCLKCTWCLQWVDCGLTIRGKEQASRLTSHYPTVIVSPLRRAQQTLDLSKITWDQRINHPLVRESRVDPSDWLENEVELELDRETNDELMARGDQFLVWIKEHARDLQEPILIISHSEFICSLTGTAPENAQSVVLDVDVGVSTI